MNLPSLKYFSVKDTDSRCGFSLIEVLVSFAVLTLTLTMLLETFSSGTWRFSRARETDEMLLIAQNQLSKLRAKSRLNTGVLQQGKNKKYAWKINATLIDNGEKLAGKSARVFRVQVAVFGHSSKTKPIQIESYLVKSHRGNR